MEYIHKFKTSYSLDYAQNKGLIARCNDGSIMIHSYITGQEIKRLKKPAHPSHLQFSRDEKYLIVKNTSGIIYVYDLEEFEVIHIIKSIKNIKVKEGKFLFNHEKNQIIDIVNINGVDQVIAFDINTKILTPITSFFEGEVYHIYCNHQVDDETFLYTIKRNNEKKDMSIYYVLKLDFTGSVVEQSIQKTSFFWDDLLYVKSMNKYILLVNDEVLLINSNFDEIERKINLSSNFPKEYLGGVFNGMLNISKSEKRFLIPLRGALITIMIPELSIEKTFHMEYTCFGEFINDDKQILIGTWKNGFVINN